MLFGKGLPVFFVENPDSGFSQECVQLLDSWVPGDYALEARMNVLSVESRLHPPLHTMGIPGAVVEVLF